VWSTRAWHSWGGKGESESMSYTLMGHPRVSPKPSTISHLLVRIFSVSRKISEWKWAPIVSEIYESGNLRRRAGWTRRLVWTKGKRPSNAKFHRWIDDQIAQWKSEAFSCLHIISFLHNKGFDYFQNHISVWQHWKTCSRYPAPGLGHAE